MKPFRLILFIAWFLAFILCAFVDMPLLGAISYTCAFSQLFESKINRLEERLKNVENRKT